MHFLSIGRLSVGPVSTVENVSCPGETALLDPLGRSMKSLRISVVDRCNLRCNYCMPEEDYLWLPRHDILSFDEIEQAVGVFAECGVSQIRLTGGEPLLRAGLADLVGRLARNPRLKDLAMTTNGTRLDRCAGPLRRAGLRRVTVSLDSLRSERFRALTRRDALTSVLAGIRAASAAGFESVKVNTVVIRGFNDDELVDLIEFGREVGAEVRFIEYMDVGGATHWSPNKVFAKADILARLRANYGAVEPEAKQGTAPADRFRLSDGTRFGIVASVTEPFCRNCDRSRLTADGMWCLCLYARDGIDLRRILRGGSERELADVIRRTWPLRTDHSAEERLDSPRRGILYRVEELKRDPHREMHTRGG
jgi:GTP 3',8-cyclase